jgi:hypothetical protein
LKENNYLLKGLPPMSLSNHERNQFELLTQNFTASDPALSAKLSRQAKKTSMTLFSAQDVNMVAYGGMVLGLIIFVSSFFSLSGAASVWAVFGGPAMTIFFWGIRSYYKAVQNFPSPQYSEQ